MGLTSWTVKQLEKLNPAQEYISGGGKISVSSDVPVFAYQQYYEQLEVLNRAVNMVVDDVAAINLAVGDSTDTSNTAIKKKTLIKLLNVKPNPYQDVNSFRRALVLDLILDGNIFIYYDGAFMYHLPAARTTINTDAKTYISSYTFDGGGITYYPEEIIHIKDNSFRSIFRGTSRLEPALRTMKIILEMRNFQDNFFKHGAVPGLVITTPDTLNQRLKDRLTAEWSSKYKPGTGGKRPVILDGGMKIDPITDVNFTDLDFQNGILEAEKSILKALGIPPILFDSGNNANIRPNHRLYYLETIIPIMHKMTSAFERFFGFTVYEDITYIEALRPELSDQASYLQSLVVAGIISRNEARLELGKPPMGPEHDQLVVPANVAGSAVNPSVGGAPSKSDGP